MVVAVIIGLLVAIATSLGFSAGAMAAGTVSWTVRNVSEPTNFSANDPVICTEAAKPTKGPKCDTYQVLVTNVGDEKASGTITLTDTLPPGIKPVETTSGKGPFNEETAEEKEWSCKNSEGPEAIWTVTCTYEETVPAGGYAPFLELSVSSPTAASGTLRSTATVTGGGTASVAEAVNETPISSQPPPFQISEFSVAPTASSGAPVVVAGAHPWEVTTTFKIPSIFAASESPNIFRPLKNIESVVAELPPGFIGNPQATPDCTPNQLTQRECPTASLVGTYALLAGGISFGEFAFTGAGGGATEPPSAVYKMVPEHGYPAEFGFTYANVSVLLYATIVHDSSGYHVRVTSPGIPAVLETDYAALTFFGNPGKLNGATETAFLTNPAVCSGGPLNSALTLQMWEDPGSRLSSVSPMYPQLTECALQQFHPSFAMAPSPAGSEPTQEGTSQADAPSAYTTDLSVPQTSAFSELATPPLKDATVTLPAGVSVSPSAATGLVGCQERGPEGINIGSSNIGPEGRDLEDPEASELGAGHAGGNGSPYDDGVYHTARGHCPLASKLGTVDVTTPLLPAPLHGSMFLAQPKCGGAAQPACTEASATNGELFGLYIEVEGSGVIVKIPGTVAANLQTGQLTASFKENPQLPFGDLKLHLHGGPRAPLANPQSCGSFATMSTLTSWGGQESAGVSPAFGIDWDGKGGACPPSLPFGPGFSAGTTTPVAGAFSPFVMTLSRQDREQNLSGVTVSLPQGLLGRIAGVPLCGEEQANAGSCGGESQIGTTSVLSGPGTQPLYVSGGRVYLTGPYKGGPFGLSIVVPAVAGPFNLGNVVVRASIHVDPSTAAVTVISDPLPQSRDGVPFRLRTVNVEINRPGGFTFNPTNCSQQSVSATIAAAQGASAVVSSPFAVTGCANLPFKPSFSASTQGQTSKANGASLTVKVAQKPGEANIHKVSLQLPLALPARLTTLQKACTEAQFNVNPAGCPEASTIGTAVAVTPVLNVPLTGPAYLVSHGGAAFPDVEFVLQGQGVQIVLDGKTDIKKGITYSKFETVPDAPVSSFETILPEGPHSALGAVSSLCGQALLAPTTIVGQNGAQVSQSTKIVVTGCARPSVKVKKVKVKGNAVLVTFNINQPGTVTISGNGLKTIKKKFSAGTHQVRLGLTKSGKAARRHHRKTRLELRLTGSESPPVKTRLTFTLR
jgi:uncharacterized repeat protein (TIGR01451 family)